MTLRDLLHDGEDGPGFDPKGGRPADLTSIYMVNLISEQEARRLLCKQKLDFARSKAQAKRELAEDAALLAQGKKPKRRFAPPPGRCGNREPTDAGQLGQQALGFPPDGRGAGAVSGAYRGNKD